MFDEDSLTITIASLVPNQVLCGVVNDPDCITIDAPQNFRATRVDSTFTANITWDAEPNTERYELERFNGNYDQWEIIYVGTDVFYSFTELEPGLNLFRIRTCQDHLCSDSSVAKQVQIESINITEHQCEPIIEG